MDQKLRVTDTKPSVIEMKMRPDYSAQRSKIRGGFIDDSDDGSEEDNVQRTHRDIPAVIEISDDEDEDNEHVWHPAPRKAPPLRQQITSSNQAQQNRKSNSSTSKTRYDIRKTREIHARKSEQLAIASRGPHKSKVNSGVPVSKDTTKWTVDPSQISKGQASKISKLSHADRKSHHQAGRNASKPNSHPPQTTSAFSARGLVNQGTQLSATRQDKRSELSSIRPGTASSSKKPEQEVAYQTMQQQGHHQSLNLLRRGDDSLAKSPYESHSLSMAQQHMGSRSGAGQKPTPMADLRGFSNLKSATTKRQSAQRSTNPSRNKSSTKPFPSIAERLAASSRNRTHAPTTNIMQASQQPSASHDGLQKPKAPCHSTSTENLTLQNLSKRKLQDISGGVDSSRVPVKKPATLPIRNPDAIPQGQKKINEQQIFAISPPHESKNITNDTSSSKGDTLGTPSRSMVHEGISMQAQRHTGASAGVVKDSDLDDLENSMPKTAKCTQESITPSSHSPTVVGQQKTAPHTISAMNREQTLLKIPDIASISPSQDTIMSEDTPQTTQKENASSTSTSDHQSPTTTMDKIQPALSPKDSSFESKGKGSEISKTPDQPPDDSSTSTSMTPSPRPGIKESSCITSEPTSSQTEHPVTPKTNVQKAPLIKIHHKGKLLGRDEVLRRFAMGIQGLNVEARRLLKPPELILQNAPHSADSLRDARKASKPYIQTSETSATMENRTNQRVVAPNTISQAPTTSSLSSSSSSQVSEPTAEPFFEYSIFLQNRLAGKAEYSPAQELSTQCFTSLSAANKHAKKFFDVLIQTRQLCALQLLEDTTKPDANGCSELMARFAPIDMPDQETSIRIHVQRDFVSIHAGITSEDLEKSTPMVKTVYLLRLFKLVAISEDIEASTEKRFGRMHQPLDCTETYGTLYDANMAAKNLQIRMCGIGQAGAAGDEARIETLRALNQKLQSLRKGEGGLWQSTFEGSGEGNVKFEVMVEKVHYCGPRNL